MAKRLMLLLPGVLLMTQVAWAQPVNDDCVDRLAIELGVTPYTTVDATTDGPAFPGACEDGLDDQCYNDVWYKFLAEETGNLVVSTCDDADYDTDLVVYDGIDCNDLVLLGCNDDDPSCQVVMWTSTVVVPVTAGNAYLIRVGGWGPDDFGTGNLSLSISVDPEICDNGIDDDFDGLTDCEDPDCVDFIDCLIEICDNGIDDDLDGLVDCDDPDCEASFPCFECPLSTFGYSCLLNQSGDSTTIDPVNTIACGVSGVGTTQNGWARCFDLDAEGATGADITITSVTFGVQQATIDDIQVDVNIYVDANTCAEGPNEVGVDVILLSTATTFVDTADEGTFITVPITAVVSVTNDVWVEVFQVVDGTIEGAEFSFRPGGNTGDECGPSYLRAADCGLVPFGDLVDIGFPDANLLLLVNGKQKQPGPSFPLSGAGPAGAQAPPDDVRRSGPGSSSRR